MRTLDRAGLKFGYSCFINFGISRVYLLRTPLGGAVFEIFASFWTRLDSPEAARPFATSPSPVAAKLPEIAAIQSHSSGGYGLRCFTIAV